MPRGMHNMFVIGRAVIVFVLLLMALHSPFVLLIESEWLEHTSGPDVIFNDEWFWIFRENVLQENKIWNSEHFALRVPRHGQMESPLFGLLQFFAPTIFAVFTIRLVNFVLPSRMRRRSEETTSVRQVLERSEHLGRRPARRPEEPRPSEELIRHCDA